MEKKKTKKRNFIGNKKEIDKIHSELSRELGMNNRNRLIGGFVTRRIINEFNQNNCFK